MADKEHFHPDHTAIRVALWRALHVELDSPPHVFTDLIGIKLANPLDDWKQRPDMNPVWTRGYRASIVARARYVEDLLEEEIKKGTLQYVVMGSGLDTFAQRRPELLDKLEIFEIDKPQMQEWKKNRLKELRFKDSPKHHLVKVDFEGGDSWWKKLIENGFDVKKKAFISSTGVAMYLSIDANKNNFIQMSSMSEGSTLVMTFMLPTYLIEPSEQAQYELVQERAKAAGTPFTGLFAPEDIINLARESGLKDVHHISRSEIINRYFANRQDGLIPASGEEFLIARVR